VQCYFLLYVLFSESDRGYATFDDQDDSQPILHARRHVSDSEVEENMPQKVHRRPRQKDRVAPVGIDEATQSMLDYIGEHLGVRYNVIGNDGGRFHVDVVLTNTGQRAIPACCWSIYLYHMKYDLVLH